jgi:carboxymethylenebutenolidase
LGVGYAATAMPIMAQTAVKTSSDALLTGTEIYDVAGEVVSLYYAQPAEKTDLPVILVVQEIFGVHEYIADTCRRLAKQGFLAIAPDLYSREGDASKYKDIGKLLTDVVYKVPDEQVLADLDGALEWAAENNGDLTKVGITGFCWGGRITWLYASMRKNVKAAVAWYGQLVGATSVLQPKHPMDVVGSLSAPVLGLYGAQDKGIDVEVVKVFQAKLAAGNKAAKASKVVIYPNSGHAFHADYRPSYVKADAQDGFKRAVAWFKTHGVK